jgi:hypothetical protein
VFGECFRQPGKHLPLDAVKSDVWNATGEGHYQNLHQQTHDWNANSES